MSATEVLAAVDSGGIELIRLDYVDWGGLALIHVRARSCLADLV